LSSPFTSSHGAGISVVFDDAERCSLLIEDTPMNITDGVSRAPIQQLVRRVEMKRGQRAALIGLGLAAVLRGSLIGWLALAFVFTTTGSAFALDVLGTKPSHIRGGPSSAPNEQAITKAIWAPGIDDGYVPQGITFAEGEVLLSSYRSTDTKVGRGPCRVYKIDVQSGRPPGQFDMPDECGHAGGLAYAGGGALIVADTRRLYKIDMKRAFRDGHAKNALLATFKLAGELKGSFVDFQGSTIFIGSSEKVADKAKGFLLPFSLFDTHNERTVREDSATVSFAIGTEAQGAAFDGQGNLWLTFSNSRFGTLQKVDPKSGRVLAQHEMVIGIEDIGFDDQGRLWSVSEAGSLRWAKWSTTFPILFQLDLSKLK
jgi:hypothetical protein